MRCVSPLAVAALLACACASEDLSVAAQALESSNPRTFRSQTIPYFVVVKPLLLAGGSGAECELRATHASSSQAAHCNVQAVAERYDNSCEVKSGQGLEYPWNEGPWGECSQRCGSGGIRSREVTCQKIIAYISDIDYSIKSIVPDKECSDLLGPKPEVFQKCNEDTPCPTWFVGHWRPCDKLCDEGKQTRQVVCYKKNDGRIELLDEKDCTEKKPDEEQPCMLQPCDGADWVVSAWSGCDSCSSMNRTRVVVCSTKYRQVLDDSFCSYHKRPVDHEKCNKNELPVCEVKWFAEQWSECSAKCGDGVQTRKVFCGMYHSDDSGEGVAVVDDTKCANLTKYQDTKPCTVPKEECTSQWFAGPWTMCTEKCGGGEQYRRVMCFQGDKEAMDCDGATVPDSTQTCNTELCRPDSLLPAAQISAAFMGEEPRKKLDCSETKFGCCPDKKTSALGPFDEGCLKSRDCKSPESKYGCCPDGLSPAQGPNNDGCPVELCADKLFGCCTSDNKTAAQGNDQDRCSPPCASSEYGCCADNKSEATGPEKKGCPETDPVGIFEDENAVVTGELGQPLLVRCELYGNRLPAVFWFRGHEGTNLLHNDTVYEVSVDVLLIKSLSTEALGLYTCIANIGEGMPLSWEVVVQAYKHEVTNSTPSTTTEASRPLVTDPVREPSVGDEKAVVTGELGQPLLVRCQVYGYRLPAVSWFRGHEGTNLLHNDTVYEVSVDVLLIKNLSIEALGLYTCIANGEGMPSSWEVVVQEYKPEGSNSTPSTTTEASRLLVSDIVVPVNCLDDIIAPCDLIVRSKFCRYKYYSKFCCNSCVRAGQLDPQEADL